MADLRGRACRSASASSALSAPTEASLALCCGGDSARRRCSRDSASARSDSAELRSRSSATASAKIQTRTALQETACARGKSALFGARAPKRARGSKSG
eukprot:6212412-Pleurochrysis_carterae.AAC.1